jgi:hypothetical protein
LIGSRVQSSEVQRLFHSIGFIKKRFIGFIGLIGLIGLIGFIGSGKIEVRFSDFALRIPKSICRGN